MNRNKIGVCDSHSINLNIGQTSTIPPRTSCEHIRRRKVLWITSGSVVVILIILVITIPIITTTKNINIEKTRLTTRITPRTTRTTTRMITTKVNTNIKWKQNGITIAGGNGQGNQLNQLDSPEGICVDDNHQTVYIADTWNNRIIEWKFGAKNVQIIASGNGENDRNDQLYRPTSVIVDNKKDSLIICERDNLQVVRWPRINGTYKQIIISYINCLDLTMDNNGDLYVSDEENSEVRRWRIGETDGTIVAGGHGAGERLNQFFYPHYIFVDQNQSVYVSDHYNHRVMKWKKGAKEGIVVAGGNGEGDSLRQLNFAGGVIVDDLENIYIADTKNNRIMRWSKESQKGSIVVGGNAEGKRPNQFSAPMGLSFDRQGNLYVVDSMNQRVQKFDVDLN